jgi:deoxyadenosine/deoxycytidine kinase
MAQIVFVLGLPGSGKSTAARYIEMLARDYGQTPDLLQDYRILYNMSLADKEGKRFSSTLPNGYDGFDVHDFSAFDDALKELVRRLQEKERTSETNEMNIIEFARDDYCKALELFASIPMTKAFFLFIDAEVETCKQRIEARVANPQTPDDHYVSEYIFEAYYNRDHRQYLTLTTACLRDRFHIVKERIKVINNTNGVIKQAFLSQIEEFVTPILRGQIPTPNGHEADPVK